MTDRPDPAPPDKPDHLDTEELVRGETLTGGISRTNRLLMLGGAVLLLALVLRTCL